MSHVTSDSFVKAILTQSIEDYQDISSIGMSLLEGNDNVSLEKKLSVMLMIFENTTGSIQTRMTSVKECFDKTLSIVVEHDLKLPEEECIIEKAIKDLAEEGEVVSAPTNVTAGIEPNVPRIDSKKKKIKEVDHVITRD